MNWNKRIGWIAVVLAVVAGIGFWARPVTCFDQALYLRECFSGFRAALFRLRAIACITSRRDRRAGRWWCWFTAWADAPRIGSICPHLLFMPVIGSICPI